MTTLSPPRRATLEILSDGKERNVKEIAKIRHITPTSCGSMLRQLATEGWVSVREQKYGSFLWYFYQITDAGRDQLSA